MEDGFNRVIAPLSVSHGLLFQAETLTSQTSSQSGSAFGRSTLADPTVS